MLVVFLWVYIVCIIIIWVLSSFCPFLSLATFSASFFHSAWINMLLLHCVWRNFHSGRTNLDIILNHYIFSGPKIINLNLKLESWKYSYYPSLLLYHGLRRESTLSIYIFIFTISSSPSSSISCWEVFIQRVHSCYGMVTRTLDLLTSVASTSLYPLANTKLHPLTVNQWTVSTKKWLVLIRIMF